MKSSDLTVFLGSDLNKANNPLTDNIPIGIFVS